MRKWILMTVGTTLLRLVLKYFKINSVKNVVKILIPYITGLILKSKAKLIHS